MGASAARADVCVCVYVCVSVCVYAVCVCAYVFVSGVPSDTPSLRERVSLVAGVLHWPLWRMTSLTDCPESGTRTATSVTLSLTAVSGRAASSWVTLLVLLFGLSPS